MTERVVLVHGLFYGGWSMAVLARRLRRAGFDTRTFGYRPTRYGLAAAGALREFVHSLDGGVVHFVGHSFGGLVILNALAQGVQAPAGRAVLLGSPLRGSRVADRLCRFRPGRWMLRAAGPPLCDGCDAEVSGWEVGLVAGSSSLGLGRLTGSLGDSDGTVALNEVELDTATPRRIRPVSHTGLLFSPRVAWDVIGFLRSGRFDEQKSPAA